MTLFRRVLSPIYRWALAKLWHIPILDEWLLAKKEAKQFQISTRKANILISQYRKSTNNNKISLAKNRFNWAIKSPIPDGDTALTWGDYYFVNEISNSLEKLGHKVRVDNKANFNNIEMSNDEINLVIRGLEPFRPVKGAINILWVISHPELVSKREIAKYDLVFAASKSWAEIMSVKSNRKVHTLLQATNPEKFNPHSSVADTFPGAIFVGNSRNRYRKIVKDAIKAEIDFKIIGKNWKKFVPSKYLEKEFISNESLSETYRAHRFVLNDHWPSMKKHGFISNRIFDAAASGARVITDEIFGLDEIFGKSVKTYSNSNELQSLTSLENLNKYGSRVEIDANAERICKLETFDNRISKMIEIVQDLISSSKE